ncbi:hypothetical protein ASG01_14015 [Chryseobacterium sp. Leaf180]|uniref:DUF5362 family protein n=1 Tax=Chryseobacterium sp. Leaf180 TaxID=1736289 RepID=UPI0006F83E64|nr:DUF5362 family protein [Chryseobacterium sp. Leaf180]KQR91482.1 hypothetical protein ASG01_14015 [Chryseobacterium sp. Leaf180]
METKSPFEQFDELKIDNASKTFLLEAAKWTSFLAILGYIGLAFMVLGALFFIFFGATVGAMGSSMMPFGGGMMIGIIYLLFAVFYYFPISYLYRFSSNMRNALTANNQASLTKAFEFLKSHYKFMGILIIVMIAFYILAMVFVMVAAMGSATM